jgi:hypothetical protein
MFIVVGNHCQPPSWMTLNFDTVYKNKTSQEQKCSGRNIKGIEYF